MDVAAKRQIALEAVAPRLDRQGRLTTPSVSAILRTYHRLPRADKDKTMLMLLLEAKRHHDERLMHRCDRSMSPPSLSSTGSRSVSGEEDEAKTPPMTTVSACSLPAPALRPIKKHNTEAWREQMTVFQGPALAEVRHRLMARSKTSNVRETS